MKIYIRKKKNNKSCGMQHAPAIRRIPSSQMANPFLYNKITKLIFEFLYSPSSSFHSSFHLTFLLFEEKKHLKRTGWCIIFENIIWFKLNSFEPSVYHATNLNQMVSLQICLYVSLFSSINACGLVYAKKNNQQKKRH